MASFYKSRYSYEDAAPHIQKLREFLALNTKRLINEDDPDREWYHYGPDNVKVEHRAVFNKLFALVEAGGFVKRIPCEDGIIILVSESADGKMPTVTDSHVRLPKLSHLITLTPDDFFAIFRLISTAKKTQTPDALNLNFPAAGLQSLAKSSLSQFFTLMRTNYRINPDYADRKWTERKSLNFIANLEPTRDNQLSAMQYLTALQNKDLLYFPIETAIELELDWQQVSDDYCVPQPDERSN